MFTNLKVKKKYFPIFCREVWKRLEKGKGKYEIKGNTEKEATDLIEELVPDFQLADIVKYAAEYLNEKKERSLFDIAGFAFIKWLVDNEKFEEKLPVYGEMGGTRKAYGYPPMAKLKNKK